jgi:hypothetical protein
MNDHEIRLRIPHELYKKYKLICVEMDLSMPRQTAQIIEQFVKIQNDNLKVKKQLKGKE